MPGSEYHDDIWARVPGGAIPEAFELRRAFLLGHVRSGETVLDLGCGTGEFSSHLLVAGARPIAVDVSRVALDRARAVHPELDIRLATPGGPLPLVDGEVQGVWAGEVLEHVHDVSGWFSEVRRVLRSGGWIALSTPNTSRAATALAVLSPRGLDRLLDPHADHLRFFNRRTLSALIGEMGFEDVVVRSAGRPLLRPHLLAHARRGRW